MVTALSSTWFYLTSAALVLTSLPLPLLSLQLLIQDGGQVFARSRTPDPLLIHDFSLFCLKVIEGEAIILLQN